ncbi:caspase domain-containing protein, partial [Mycena latifolia]
MKIGRSTYTSYSRRTPVPASVPSSARPRTATDPPREPEPRAPLKKALLIGIRSAGPGYAALAGPHRDVRLMRELLIGRYEYKGEDVVVLLDSEEGGEEGEGLQPTRENILRAIGDLVRGARSGDRFFFHYCGHTTQIANRSNSEEDGLDECLVPADGEAHVIMDNELRRHLIDPLPVGAALVAVFDSCHSASLLGER